MLLQPLRIAHISDLHVLDLAGTTWRQYLNKRVTGVANLLGARRNAHPVALAEKLADRLAKTDIDHVFITGDLTNLALDSEFARAKQVIARIGPPHRVTLIPGNHDLYTKGSLKSGRFEQWFSTYLSDNRNVQLQTVPGRRDHFPLVRVPAPHIRVYGLSSAVPTLPLIAQGQVGDAQLQRLEALVAAEPAEVTVRVVLVHHNLHRRHAKGDYMSQLLDRKAVAATIRRIGATLVLHGHTHNPHQGHLARLTAAPIPVLGCGSSTWHRQDKEYARFNVITVGADRLVSVVSHRYASHADQFELEHTDLLDRALQPDRAIAL